MTVLDRGQHRQVAVADGEARVGRAAQQPVELRELAALALPSHPSPLAGVPAAIAMKEEEAARPVPLVELVDPPLRGVEQRGFPFERRPIGVRMVAEQREVEVRVAVGQEAHFQVVEQAEQPRLGVDDRGNGHDGPVFRGDAVAHGELRQLARRHQRGDDQVEHADDELADREQHDEPDQQELGVRRAAARRVDEQAGHAQERRRGDRTQVTDGRVAEREAREPLAQPRPVADVVLQPEAAAGDQVVADVMPPVAGGLVAARDVRQLDRAADDVGLGPPCALGELLDRVAVAIARREVHQRVRAGRVAAQQLLDEADALEKQRPVDGRHPAHARDHVADRELIGGLALVLDPQHLVGRVVLLLQRVLERLPRRPRRGRLVAQPLQQLHDERRREPVVVLPALLEEPADVRLGPVRADLQSFVPAPRLLAAPAGGDDAVGETAQLFDEGEPQHDRDRPDLADRELRPALVGVDEIDQRLQIDPARRVRDELLGQEVDARVSLEGTVGELGQLEVVIAREVLADLADLVLHDVVVVAEPVLRRDRVRIRPRGGRKKPVRLLEPRRALVEPGKKGTAAPGILGQAMGDGDSFGIRFELILAEYLGGLRVGTGRRLDRWNVLQHLARGTIILYPLLQHRGGCRAWEAGRV